MKKKLETLITSQQTDLYPDIETHRYLDHQTKLFEEKRHELLNEYAGMYVVFEDGKVIDADEDEAALVMGAYSKSSPRHLFVKKVVQ